MAVFVAVRDRIHKGFPLVTHPLSGSMMPHENPYKSICVSQEHIGLDIESLGFIENAIRMLKPFETKVRETPESMLGDYRLLDACLIASAIQTLN